MVIIGSSIILGLLLFRDGHLLNNIGLIFTTLLILITVVCIPITISAALVKNYPIAKKLGIRRKEFALTIIVKELLVFAFATAILILANTLLVNPLVGTNLANLDLLELQRLLAFNNPLRIGFFIFALTALSILATALDLESKEASLAGGIYGVSLFIWMFAYTINREIPTFLYVIIGLSYLVGIGLRTYLITKKDL